VHIVHLIARLNDGGPARVIASLARELGARGHRVSVLAGDCADGEPDASALVRAAGAAVERVPGLGRRLAPWDDLRALAAIRRRLRALAPDVVHTHTAKAGALGRPLCRLLGLPCLHTYHGHVLSGYFSPARSRLVAAGERLLAGNAWHQALTAGQRDDLQRRARIGRARRWTVLPVPVAPLAAQAPAWPVAAGPPVVGFLGRLAPVKDIGLWLETVALLAAHGAVRGLVCGEGVERAAAERRAAGLPIRFTGQVPAGMALAAMDVLLLTSRNEGLPLAAVEAGGLGVPVVAPAVGGLADLARQGALESAPRSAAALAAAVARVLADPELRRRRCAAGRALAAALAPAALAPRYEALYRAVARGRP
jgi:glycosyltransferase involved in cell wall biosynthesis